MKKCKFEKFIDDYLLNKLSKAEKEKFEQHYFECPNCFEKLVKRDELISTIKLKGSEIFENPSVFEQSKKLHKSLKIFAFLTPKKWAYITVSAALVLFFVFAVITTNLKNPSPKFSINEDLVRGESITLISPVIDINAVPSKFAWKGLRKDVEYKIYIYNKEVIWKSTTKENYIILPEEIKNLMTPGEEYSWQIKAFSTEGRLIALSSRVRFKVNSGK